MELGLCLRYRATERVSATLVRRELDRLHKIFQLPFGGVCQRKIHNFLPISRKYFPVWIGSGEYATISSEPVFMRRGACGIFAACAACAPRWRVGTRGTVSYSIVQDSLERFPARLRGCVWSFAPRTVSRKSGNGFLLVTWAEGARRVFLKIFLRCL